MLFTMTNPTPATPGSVRAAEAIANYMVTGMHPATHGGKDNIAAIIDRETRLPAILAAVEKALAAWDALGWTNAIPSEVFDKTNPVFEQLRAALHSETKGNTP